ncbi:MAG: dephospho-CoA kinase [Deltaproteobacteria bacterium]|nr:dephospho-CoA kinase [Deltaproteobacteria bacterium]
MKTNRDWEKPVRRMELLMRLKSFPVAFKLLEKQEALADIPFLRRMTHKVTLCQLITLVRTFDWTVGADLNDFLSPMCPSIIGLAGLPEVFKDGTFRSIVWTKSRKDGQKYESSIPRLPTGRYQAVAMAPLVYNPFDPDLVLIYANPAQMMLLINSLQFEDYEVMDFYCVGESSCSDAIARCYLKGKPFLSIPCYGERRYGHAQDDELIMALPAGMMDKALKGMEALYKRGIRFPISYAGAEMDLTYAFPMSYSGLQQLEEIRGKDNRILLGVTGGIASGKTTVARMLEDLGAPIIDFDLLSRVVAEPNKPAWKEIVAYFGEQVLLEDKTLDRKKLSQIVFREPEKRKKLESFIHPRIYHEFARLVKDFTAQDPQAIIQVIVPLLLEANLQHLFHKILLVYIPQEMQAERLMKRDRIPREMAANILNAQLPIEEKKGYADFILDNSGTLEETKRQVEEVWKKLKQMQKERRQA